MHQKFAYTLSQFCRQFPCSRSEAYREIARGRLAALKRGRNTIITADAAKAWLEGLPTYSPSKGKQNA